MNVKEQFGWVYLVASCVHNQLLQKGQLGHGDLVQRNVPTIVSGLSGKAVIAGQCQSQQNWQALTRFCCFAPAAHIHAMALTLAALEVWSYRCS